MSEKTIIKFKGKLNSRYPQFFPKNNAMYQDGDFCILNMDVVEEIEGDIEVSDYGTLTIKGNMPYIHDFHKNYIVLAEVTHDKKYGKQHTVLMVNEDISFENVEQQKIFLQAFLSDNQIQSLYESFSDPIKIIAEQNIEKLCNVKDIGEKTARKIIEKYEENADYSEAYVELSSYGLTPHMIKKLVNEYESPKTLISKIKKNPYILAAEVSGIGFKKADEMALNNGISRFSQVRLRAFISHILNEGAMSGYSWISSDVLINKIETELDEFPMEDIAQAVLYLKEKRILWDGEKGKIALQRYYDLETKIKDELIAIRDSKCNFDFTGWEDRVKQAEKLQGWDYTDEQRQAIEDTLKHQVNIISGLGGTGKSSTALGAVKALGDVSFAQCSLSGKAAARIQEITGYDSYTIHRLLGFNPNNYGEEGTVFIHNKNNPLGLDVILVDEFAMIGGSLFYSLLQAIPSGSKLILLGDDGQLPAIGALNIGSDLTNSPHIHTNMLTKIHRQALKSAVITESIKIRHGEQIVDKKWEGKEKRGELQDLELDIYNDGKLTVDKCVEHFKEKLELSGNDIMEVQLITPMSMRGDCCVYTLNNLIQPLYNPSSPSKTEVFLPLAKDKGYTLRVGDKVINTKNNYHMEIAEKDEMWNAWSPVYNDLDKEEVAIFNGFVGEIIDISNNDLIVSFPLVNKTVRVDSSHWKSEKGIQLAYALTAHKTQGSSYKYPICAIDYSHYIMLTRELLYTMITRASKHCTLIAENRALRYAITQTAVETKQTFLKDLLNQN